MNISNTIPILAALRGDSVSNGRLPFAPGVYPITPMNSHLIFFRAITRIKWEYGSADYA